MGDYYFPQLVLFIPHFSSSLTFQPDETHQKRPKILKKLRSKFLAISLSISHSLFLFFFPPL